MLPPQLLLQHAVCGDDTHLLQVATSSSLDPNLTNANQSVSADIENEGVKSLTGYPAPPVDSPDSH